jgi:hypothetical protein
MAKKRRMPPEADRNRGENIAMTSDTKKVPDRPDESRRTFLRTGLVGATATAFGAGAIATPAAASESDSEKKKARYQETAHVKKYYQTNRY